MSCKKKNIKNKPQDHREMILAFAHRLRLPDIEAYRQWCANMGLSTRLNKTQRELAREYRLYVDDVAACALKKQKRESNLRSYINKLYSQEIRYAGLQGEILHAISDGFSKTQNRRLLRDVLCHLDNNSKLLLHVEYVKGVISMVSHFHQWVRPFSQWKPKTRNAHRQFASLARHLFANYPIPAFMDSVWYDGDGKAKSWFIHIGMGNNIRTAAGLPICLTKKMAHQFSRAPSHYTLNAAFRWAQVQALGGNKAVADAVVETRLARQFIDDEFWLSVLRFFVENPLLDRCHYVPVIDYIWNQKYEAQPVFVERGVVREDPPLQPNFTMRGRTPETLLRQMEQWHLQLGKETRIGNTRWAKSNICDFRFVEGNAEHHNMKVWTIRELLDRKELAAEGRVQKHCVATYAGSCLKGHTSIWTMDVQTHLERKKLVTIELSHPGKCVCQVRGKRNRLATPEEISVIQRWVGREGLTIAAYLSN
ncbi:MAG: PcfJ domain-containing protein [Gammaproteobacteria bacterium]|nr:PcfJ domain-containing protein [Gammaproteobacteria bacterium]MDH5800631.1 PcfJ domain-containing protein [Gammaproteobacteria bacterium]